MDIYEKFSRRLPELFGIPDQTLPGVPIIEIFGDSRVLIEGHCVVTQYSGSQIALRNGRGTICVSGCDLCMAELSRTQLIITGRIEGISIAKG